MLPEVGEMEDTEEVKVKFTAPEASPLLGTRTCTGWSPLGPTDMVHSNEVAVAEVTEHVAPPAVTSLLEASNPVPVMVTVVPRPPVKTKVMHCKLFLVSLSTDPDSLLIYPEFR